jgi:hypothetical protein
LLCSCAESRAMSCIDCDCNKSHWALIDDRVKNFCAAVLLPSSPLPPRSMAAQYSCQHIITQRMNCFQSSGTLGGFFHRPLTSTIVSTRCAKPYMYYTRAAVVLMHNLLTPAIQTDTSLAQPCTIIMTIASIKLLQSCSAAT